MMSDDTCGAELVLDSDTPNGCVFVCGRHKGHSLVHVDNSRGRAVGDPSWSMVWHNAGAPEHTEPLLEVPRW